MFRAWFVIIALLCFSCGEDNSKLAAAKEGSMKDEVYSVSGKDTMMNAAIEKAVNTWPEFEKAFYNRDSSMTGFAVKMSFGGEEGRGEHMWLKGLFERDGKLYGILKSEPLHVDRLQPGDTLLIKKDSVSDWIYVQHGKAKGGYTIKMLYDLMDEEEKKEFKEAFSYEFE